MTITPPPWHRPHIQCHRAVEPGVAPAAVPSPGTVVPGPNGDTVVYVGDRWTATAEETHSLAAVLRHARTITLVGSLSAGRPARQALYDAWSAVRKAERAAARPPAPPVRGLCGQPRRDGLPCTQRSGWGADDPDGPCRYHGGSTAVREQRREELVAQTELWVELTTRARTGPLSPAENLALLVAERAVRTASREGWLR